MDLNEDKIRELSEFYWETDISTLDIQNHFELTKPVNKYITPYITNVNCPNCDTVLVYKSRSAKKEDNKNCPACGHKNSSIYLCRCNHCKLEKKEITKKREVEQKKIEAELLRKRIEETSSTEYILWGISKLSRREKIFLKSFLELLSENNDITWQDVCTKAKVVSHKSYVNKLLKIGLLYQSPDGIIINQNITLDMIDIKVVRNISKSLRFDVFQRDEHTCQYCGRKSPDVELEIDHLYPVAEGGTDDYDNLVTSCFDCNRGKSAKIIMNHTGGYSRDEWKKIIRNKRESVLENRREELNEVIEFWAECRGTNYPSDYDLKGIYTFIEKYDPDWIKAAIKITKQKSPSNYVKYTAGILRNWGENGPPISISNPDLSLEKKKATQKQIAYIIRLLENLGLELDQFYFKKEYDDLTMLDARNIIETLTESQIKK